MDKMCMTMAALIFYFLSSAQTTNSHNGKDSSQKKVNISGMLLTRFGKSFDTNIDVNGKYHTQDQNYSTASFSIRRARIQAKAQITSRADAAVLLNLTDFIGNPTNKVLENAYLRYHFTEAFNLQVGQFRPYFGREDLYPEELLQALEWTNQYYAFGANGWQSFQVGATLFGQFSFFDIPVNYYVGMFNGNGRNQPMDDDNGKLFPARLEFSFRPETKLGLNGGLGKHSREKLWAYNIDVDHTEKVGERWELEIQAEYKRGINNSLYDTSTECNKQIANYQLSGFYVLPNLKYHIGNSHLKSLEFAMRYESFNCDILRSGNAKQTWMPVVSVQLADEYSVKIETGLIIDQYTIRSSKERNGTRLICQLQARF